MKQHGGVSPSAGIVMPYFADNVACLIMVTVFFCGLVNECHDGLSDEGHWLLII